jgi:hypothetical protein
MPMLAAVLDEAQGHPCLVNTTVLNTDQFRTIRGPSSPRFRARLDAAIVGSDDLHQVQQVNADDGLEVIEPISGGIHGGFWYLRNVTHHGEMFPAGEAHYRSLVDALQAAVEWWQGDPSCREIIVRSYDVVHAGGASG